MANLPVDPARNLETLLRCPSVTPLEGGALAALERMLVPLGFGVERPVFHEADEASVENLLATRGNDGPHLCFAGHTDVVPPGPDAAWRHPPFSGAVENGEMWGRGAVDMKGGIACFVAAVARLAERGALPEPCRLSFLVTGDEEGPAVNGTVKLLRHAEEKGLRFDACLVGEPTNPDALGDMIKIGRRGSLSGALTLRGRQGHVAYPARADNPLHRVPAVMAALIEPQLDGGTSRFQPTNLEFTSVDAANPSTNVIPAAVTLRFNVRFNDCWTPDTLRAEIERRVTGGLARLAQGPGSHEIAWREPASESFVTEGGPLTETLSAAVERVTGRRPELSTSGGTSDARFIKNHCPVVEFGLVGRTMHMADERVALSDLETLTRIYETFIARWLAAHA